MKLHSAVIALLLLMAMPSARTEETAAMIGSTLLGLLASACLLGELAEG